MIHRIRGTKTPSRILLVVLLAAICWSVEAKSQVAPAQATNWDFTLSDATGASHSTAEWRQSKAVALLFIATECPISNGYAPEINRIFTAYASAGVAFYAVQSDPDLTPAEARQHAEAYGYRFPVLLDPSQVLAKKLGVNLTPTAVVLSPTGGVLYRGRIDNRYIDLGRERTTITKRDLRLALDATLAARPVDEPVTKPVGCFLPAAVAIHRSH